MIAPNIKLLRLRSKIKFAADGRVGRYMSDIRTVTDIFCTLDIPNTSQLVSK